MGGLAPLMLRFLVAVTAILRGGKVFGVDEFTGIGGHERRQEMSVFAEVIVVFFHYLRAVGSASGGSLVRFAAGFYGSKGSGRDKSCEVESARKNSQDEGQATANLGGVRGHEIRQMDDIRESDDDSEI